MEMFKMIPDNTEATATVTANSALEPATASAAPSATETATSSIVGAVVDHYSPGVVGAVVHYNPRPESDGPHYTGAAGGIPPAEGSAPYPDPPPNTPYPASEGVALSELHSASQAHASPDRVISGQQHAEMTKRLRDIEAHALFWGGEVGTKIRNLVGEIRTHLQ